MFVAHMQHTYSTSAAHLQHTNSTLAAHLQHICNTPAACVQHTCNTSSACWQHINQFVDTLVKFCRTRDFKIVKIREMSMHQIWKSLEPPKKIWAGVFMAILIFNTAGIPTAYRQDDYRGLSPMRQDNSNLPGCEVLYLHRKSVHYDTSTVSWDSSTVCGFVKHFQPLAAPRINSKSCVHKKVEPTLRAMTHILVGLKMKYNKIKH